MKREFSLKLQTDVDLAVTEAIASHVTVNVPHVAELVRLQNLAENIAREDIEMLVLQRARASGAAMAFSAIPSNPSLGIAGE